MLVIKTNKSEIKMLTYKAILFAVMALLCADISTGSGPKTIKLASLTKGVWKYCLQTDSAKVAPAKIPLDIGGFIHISNIEMYQQNCDEFHLSKHVDDFLIVVPDRVGSNCYHFSDCVATIIMRNEKVILGNSKCFDIFQGHYWHDQGLDSVKEFKVANVLPRGITCDYTKLDSLIRSNKPKAVGDIFSPIEDLINQSTDQFKTLGNQFTTKITGQFNTLASTITDQVNQVVLVVQQETLNVTATVAANYHVVAVKLEEVDQFIKKDVGLFERYFHIFV